MYGNQTYFQKYDDPGSVRVYSVFLFVFSCILESIHIVFMHIHALVVVLVNKNYAN